MQQTAQQKLPAENHSYYIDHFDKCEPHWPNGAWSVYAITGDQIADRIVREKVNPSGYYEGKVIARHSWCGYLGMWEKLDDAVAAIAAHRKANPQGN